MSRQQRYRMTFEFILRDRKDYKEVTTFLRDAMDTAQEMLSRGQFQGDYLAFEKVEENSQ